MIKCLTFLIHENSTTDRWRYVFLGSWCVLRIKIESRLIFIDLLQVVLDLQLLGISKLRLEVALSIHS